MVHGHLLCKQNSPRIFDFVVYFFVHKNGPVAGSAISV
jgi:hypothetical protein